MVNPAELLGKGPGATKRTAIVCDEDFEPDKLIPEFLATKKRLLEIERKHAPASAAPEAGSSQDSDTELTKAKLEARLKRIENDVLFDRFLADQQWRSQKVTLEKEISAAKRESEALQRQGADASPQAVPSPSINDEAERIAAEILADDDDDITGLFESLPQNEVDPATGKTQTVVNSTDGTRTVIKDFGKWTGVAPRRILEEACRSR
jgi:ATP-dependent RNA helicase DHX29